MAVYDISGESIAISGGYLDYDKIAKGVAHRGLSTVAPENTLPAYRMAKKEGFNYAECDVSYTSDGVPVLLHDATIDRTSNGSGKISEMTFDEVRAYDFGSWKSEKYAGTVIPTFKEFIILCKNIGLHPYIEIKRSGGFDSVKAQELIDIVKSCGMLDKVTWVSFSATYLGRIKDCDANARLGYVVEGVTESIVTTAQSLKTDSNEVFIDAKWTVLTDAMVDIAYIANIPLEVWVIDTESEFSTMNPYISGVTSNSLIAGKVLYETNIDIT